MKRWLRILVCLVAVGLPLTSQAFCALDVSSVVPNGQVGISGCGFTGNASTFTSAEGDQISIPSGTSDGGSVTIPAFSQFIGGGSMGATEIDEQKTWQVCDDSGTPECQNVSLTIDPPAGVVFLQPSCVDPDCPNDSVFEHSAFSTLFTGLTTADDVAWSLSSGDCTIGANGVPAGSGLCSVKWYDETGVVWSTSLSVDMTLTVEAPDCDPLPPTLLTEVGSSVNVDLSSYCSGVTTYSCTGLAEGTSLSDSVLSGVASQQQMRLAVCTLSNAAGSVTLNWRHMVWRPKTKCYYGDTRKATYAALQSAQIPAMCGAPR